MPRAAAPYRERFSSMTANEPRIAPTDVISTCREPSCHTIFFEEASPTFKKRFMWMSNYDDEAKFDEFVKPLTWEGHAESICSPLHGGSRRSR